jgi:hypothetical protein
LLTFVNKDGGCNEFFDFKKEIVTLEEGQTIDTGAAV